MAIERMLMEGRATGVYRNNLHVPTSLHLTSREYVATLEERDGYRYLHLIPIPRIKVFERFLGRLIRFPELGRGDLELTLRNNSIRLPQPVLDYLGMLAHDRAVIMVSPEEGIRIWDFGELMRYYDSMNIDELNQVERKLHDMLKP